MTRTRVAAPLLGLLLVACAHALATVTAAGVAAVAVPTRLPVHSRLSGPALAGAPLHPSARHAGFDADAYAKATGAAADGEPQHHHHPRTAAWRALRHNTSLFEFVYPSHGTADGRAPALGYDPATGVAQHPDRYVFHVKAAGRAFALDVKRVDTLVHDAYAAHVVDGESGRRTDTRTRAHVEHCHFAGRVVAVDGAGSDGAGSDDDDDDDAAPNSVVLSVCNGLRGVIHAFGESLAIEPATDAYHAMTAGGFEPHVDADDRHIVYRTRDLAPPFLDDAESGVDSAALMAAMDAAKAKANVSSAVGSGAGAGAGVGACLPANERTMAVAVANSFTRTALYGVYGTEYNVLLVVNVLASSIFGAASFSPYCVSFRVSTQWMFQYRDFPGVSGIDYGSSTSVLAAMDTFRAAHSAHMLVTDLFVFFHAYAPPSGALGDSRLGSACLTGSARNTINAYVTDTTFYRNALTFARAAGRALNMAPVVASGYLMSAESVAAWPLHPDSITQAVAFLGAHPTCLYYASPFPHWTPPTPWNAAVCGNGIVESGEECDPGQGWSEADSQCDDTNCQLLGTAACSPVAACCSDAGTVMSQCTPTECANGGGGPSCCCCPAGYTYNAASGCVSVNACATDNGGCGTLTCYPTPGGDKVCGSACYFTGLSDSNSNSNSNSVLYDPVNGPTRVVNASDVTNWACTPSATPSTVGLLVLGSASSLLVTDLVLHDRVTLQLFPYLATTVLTVRVDPALNTVNPLRIKSLVVDGAGRAVIESTVFDFSIVSPSLAIGGTPAPSTSVTLELNVRWLKTGGDGSLCSTLSKPLVSSGGTLRFVGTTAVHWMVGCGVVDGTVDFAASTGSGSVPHNMEVSTGNVVVLRGGLKVFWASVSSATDYLMLTSGAPGGYFSVPSSATLSILGPDSAVKLDSAVVQFGAPFAYVDIGAGVWLYPLGAHPNMRVRVSGTTGTIKLSKDAPTPATSLYDIDVSANCRALIRAEPGSTTPREVLIGPSAGPATRLTLAAFATLEIGEVGVMEVRVALNGAVASGALSTTKVIGFN